MLSCNYFQLGLSFRRDTLLKTIVENKKFESKGSALFRITYRYLPGRTWEFQTDDRGKSTVDRTRNHQQPLSAL